MNKLFFIFLGAVVILTSCVPSDHELLYATADTTQASAQISPTKISGEEMNATAAVMNATAKAKSRATDVAAGFKYIEIQDLSQNVVYDDGEVSVVLVYADGMWQLEASNGVISKLDHPDRDYTIYFANRAAVECHWKDWGAQEIRIKCDSE